MPVLPSGNRGGFLEFQAVTLSLRLDLNLESTGQEPSPCLGASPLHWAHANPQVKDVRPRVPRPLVPPSPPACALFESFFPVSLPHGIEKGAAAPPQAGGPLPPQRTAKSPLLCPQDHAVKRWVLSLGKAAKGLHCGVTVPCTPHPRPRPTRGALPGLPPAQDRRVVHSGTSCTRVRVLCNIATSLQCGFPSLPCAKSSLLFLDLAPPSLSGRRL